MIPRRRAMVRAWAGLAAFCGLALLAACNSNKTVEPPAELTRFEATARLQKVWSANVGGGEPKLRLGLGVALDGNAVFAAGHDGDIAAYDLQTGKRLWQTQTKLPLSGGPGAGEGVVVAGASHGDLIALDAATGAVKWKTHINSELLSQPAIADGVVALRAVDGRLLLLRLTDGSQIWAAEQQVPRLSLRGTGSPVIAGGVAVSGFDNGRVMALNVADGTTAWEATVAPPSGRTELERLVDIDSAARVADDDVYAVTYQGRIARLARDSGQLWWTRDLSSYSGLALDDDAVYVSTSEGTVVKIGRRTGVEMWRQEALARRRLSAPAALGEWVAVGDLDGYVHLLDAASGAFAARLQASGGAFTAAPVTGGGMAIFMDNGGRITALRAVALTPRSGKPAPAAAG
ncbi:MAG: outer membrane protein assembly factor BamB [Steroidobacteraceae bacterium]